MNWEAVAKVLGAAVGAIDSIIERVQEKKEAHKVLEASADALTTIGAIVDAVAKGNIDAIDPEDAGEQIDHLLRALRENDAAADAALDDKFPAA